MTTVTVIAVERSGPGIRAALARHVPADCARFETEIRDALTAAADGLRSRDEHGNWASL